MVKKMEGDTVIKSTSQEEMENFIIKEIEFRFQLTTESPISSTKLIDQLGYLGNNKITQKLVEGKFDIPEEIDDTTALILEEICKSGVKLTNREVTIDVTPDDFKYLWKRVNSFPGKLVTKFLYT